MVVSSLAGERLVRFLFEQEKKSVIPRHRKTICEELGFSREEYQEIAQELVDNGLVENVYGDVPSERLLALRLTAEGRNAFRRGFKRETLLIGPSSVSIGAIIGTLEGGSIQAVGAAIDSTISQVVNDPQLLTEQIDRISEEVLDVVREELSGIDLDQYTKALDKLRDELLSSRPGESRVRRGLRILAFLGDLREASP